MKEPGCHESKLAVSDAGSERADLFVRLLGQNQRRIFMYVMNLVPNWNDADDIVQETNLVLWRSFDQFQPGTNFTAWACKTAFHQVLAWRKRKRRDQLQFSPALLESLADEALSAAGALEERCGALTGCIQKLPPEHQQLLLLRYEEHLTVETIAGRTGRTVQAVYRVLSRIRGVLHDCIDRALAQEA
jgi:RNA polymerase sigma-70 factor (ECF subfamily)